MEWSTIAICLVLWSVGGSITGAARAITDALYDIEGKRRRGLPL